MQQPPGQELKKYKTLTYLAPPPLPNSDLGRRQHARDELQPRPAHGGQVSHSITKSYIFFNTLKIQKFLKISLHIRALQNILKFVQKP